MAHVCEIIQNDNFIQMLNKSNPSTAPLEELQEKWMFGFEEQNPFLPTFEFLTCAFPQKKAKREEEIICKNKELFNVNQSKSIYLSKITQLIDTDITPKQKRANEKYKRKLASGESSEDQFGGNTHQQKLARNRQSARDSRKRKKIYIELLENKVEELSQEIGRLQGTIASQNTYINYCAKIPSMIKDFHTDYQHQLQNVRAQPGLPQLQLLEQDFGVQSLRRVELCNSFFNTLVDHVIPSDLKKIMESAVKSLDIFSEDSLKRSLQETPLREAQSKLKEEMQLLELYMFDMLKIFERVRLQTAVMERLRNDVIRLVTPRQYALFLVSSVEQVIIKEEEQGQGQSQGDHLQASPQHLPHLHQHSQQQPQQPFHNH